jgi:hypothetical protein
MIESNLHLPILLDFFRIVVVYVTILFVVPVPIIDKRYMQESAEQINSKHYSCMIAPCVPTEVASDDCITTSADLYFQSLMFGYTPRLVKVILAPVVVILKPRPV